MDEKKNVEKDTTKEVSKDDPKAEEKKLKKKNLSELVLPILPNESESLDAEMSEIFEEDSVKHQHGGEFPESD